MTRQGCLEEIISGILLADNEGDSGNRLPENATATEMRQWADRMLGHSPQQSTSAGAIASSAHITRHVQFKEGRSGPVLYCSDICKTLHISTFQDDHGMMRCHAAQSDCTY